MLSRPLGRPEDAGQRPQRRRLARPVGAEQAEDLARRHGERDVRNRGRRAVDLAVIFHVDGHAALPLSVPWGTWEHSISRERERRQGTAAFSRDPAGERLNEIP